MRSQALSPELRKRPDHFTLEEVAGDHLPKSTPPRKGSLAMIAAHGKLAELQTAILSYLHSRKSTPASHIADIMQDEGLAESPLDVLQALNRLFVDGLITRTNQGKASLSSIGRLRFRIGTDTVVQTFDKPAKAPSPKRKEPRHQIAEEGTEAFPDVSTTLPDGIPASLKQAFSQVHASILLTLLAMTTMTVRDLTRISQQGSTIKNSIRNELITLSGAGLIKDHFLQMELDRHSKDTVLSLTHAGKFFANHLARSGIPVPLTPQIEEIFTERVLSKDAMSMPAPEAETVIAPALTPSPADSAATPDKADQSTILCAILVLLLHGPAPVTTLSTLSGLPDSQVAQLVRNLTGQGLIRQNSNLQHGASTYEIVSKTRHISEEAAFCVAALAPYLYQSAVETVGSYVASESQDAEPSIEAVVPFFSTIAETVKALYGGNQGSPTIGRTSIRILQLLFTAPATFDFLIIVMEGSKPTEIRRALKRLESLGLLIRGMSMDPTEGDTWQINADTAKSARQLVALFPTSARAFNKTAKASLAIILAAARRLAVAPIISEAPETPSQPRRLAIHLLMVLKIAPAPFDVLHAAGKATDPATTEVAIALLTKLRLVIAPSGDEPSSDASWALAPDALPVVHTLTAIFIEDATRFYGTARTALETIRAASV